MKGGTGRKPFALLEQLPALSFAYRANQTDSSSRAFLILPLLKLPRAVGTSIAGE